MFKIFSFQQEFFPNLNYQILSFAKTICLCAEGMATPLGSYNLIGQSLVD